MNKRIGMLSAVVVLFATALYSTGAAAQMDIFVKVADISGGSTDDRHKDWIEAVSVLEALKGSSSATAGAHSSGAAQVEPITIKKRLDRSSPSLRLNLMKGKHLVDVIIEFCKAGGDKSKIYSITLKDVVISSINSTTGNGVQMEEVSFDFTSVEWTYVDTDQSGKKSGTVKAGWDLKKNKAI
jgi:type VI secretion system secreted protein Hcp